MAFKIYCKKCGEKLPEDSKFCTKCGTPVKSEATAEMVVHRFEKDPNLQDHWIKRVVAYFIDSVIVSIATGILLVVALFPIFISDPLGFFNLFNFQFAIGALAVVYFTIAEIFYGTTFGKSLLGLKVVTKSGEKLVIEKAVIRNISKIIPVLPLLDVIGGVLTSTDLHQKYSDRIANTTVISITDSARI